MRMPPAILNERPDDQREDDHRLNDRQGDLRLTCVLDALGHHRRHNRQPNSGGKRHPARAFHQTGFNHHQHRCGRRDRGRYHEHHRCDQQPPARKEPLFRAKDRPDPRMSGPRQAVTSCSGS